MKRKSKDIVPNEKYMKIIRIFFVSVTIIELLLLFVISPTNIHPFDYRLCQAVALIILIAAWFLIEKFFFIPIMELQGKLMQLYANVPQKYRATIQDDTFLTGVLEDILAYQEQLINTELLSKYLLKESELSALQSQINPHFLFNTLESIRGYAYREGVPEIARITEAMSSLFRSSIRQGKEQIPLYEEIENVNNYVMVQQFRFPGRFEFSIHMDHKNTENFQVPNLIIQPIVENAIFHGVETKLGSGKIVVDISTTEKRIIIRVTDDGVGIPNRTLSYLQSCLDAELPAEDQKTADDIGIGILNIHRRIRLQFGLEYGVTVASTVNVGTEVEITLPVLLGE